jgi:hypothetical protein
VRRLPFSIALFVSIIAIGRIARADDAAAQGGQEDKRATDALAACASGDTAKGVAILGTLYAESLNPAYVFNQGRCYQKNGQLEQARVRFDEYLRIGTKEPPEDIQRAQGFIKEIDATLAQQRASAPAPVVVAPAEDREGRRKMLRTTSIVLAAVGVAAVGVGVFMSFKVKSTNDSIDQGYSQPYVTDQARLEQLISDGKSYQTWQWVGYGLGVAALGGAATTFLLSGGFGGSGPAAAEHVAVTFTPTVSPDGAGGVLRLRF